MATPAIAAPCSTTRLTIRAPILASFKEWLDQKHGPVLPKNPLGQAISYALSNWDALCRYCKQGYLAIDKNAAERAIKQVVIGRKTWLFVGSDNGSRTAAILYSFTVTCKRHGINVFEYLRDVIDRVSTHPANRIDELLPDRWQALRQEHLPD